MTIIDLKKLEEIADEHSKYGMYHHSEKQMFDVCGTREQYRLDERRYRSEFHPEVAKQLIKLARIGIAAKNLVGALEIHLHTMQEINAHGGYKFSQPLIKMHEALKQYREMMGE